MKYLIVPITALFLFGCAQSKVRVCQYSLKENGWKKAKSVSQELINDQNRKYSWFTNEKGDYLACPKKKGHNFCGNVYLTFIKLKNDGYKEQEIVCTS